MGYSGGQTMNNDLVQMKNNLLEKFEVIVEETHEMAEKVLLLHERLDKLKNLMRAQDILSNDAERFFLYLDTQIRLDREDNLWIFWIYLPTKTTVSILNAMEEATTMEEVDFVLSPFQSEF